MKRMLHWSQLNGFSPDRQNKTEAFKASGHEKHNHVLNRPVFLILTTVDFLMSLEEVLLNETHVALTASKGSFT